MPPKTPPNALRLSLEKENADKTALVFKLSIVIPLHMLRPLAKTPAFLSQDGMAERSVGSNPVDVGVLPSPAAITPSFVAIGAGTTSILSSRGASPFAFVSMVAPSPVPEDNLRRLVMGSTRLVGLMSSDSSPDVAPDAAAPARLALFDTALSLGSIGPLAPLSSPLRSSSFATWPVREVLRCTGCLGFIVPVGVAPVSMQSISP